MGNCGYNCLPCNNDVTISTDSDISSLSTVNTDISSQIHSKLSPKLFSGSHISTVSGKIFPINNSLKCRSPILMKLQKKRATPQQLF